MSYLIGKNPSTDQETLGALKSRVLEGHLLNKSCFKTANLFIFVHCHGLSRTGTYQAVIALLVGESRDTQAGLTKVLHVVVHSLVDASQELECFIDASGRDESVSRSNGRDDVFDHAHC